MGGSGGGRFSRIEESSKRPPPAFRDRAAANPETGRWMSTLVGRSPRTVLAAGKWYNGFRVPGGVERSARDLDRYLVVLAGAGLGGLARFVVGTSIMSKWGGRFPMGTLVVNVSGSFLVGVLMILLTERFQPHPNWRLFLVVGVLGGYTTFSSFEYETYQAIRGGAPWI